MGMYLALELLVIAGLRSYTSYRKEDGSPRSVTRSAQEIEDTAGQQFADGEYSFWRLLIYAVKPGGTIILVDREHDALPMKKEPKVGLLRRASSSLKKALERMDSHKGSS